MFNWLRKLIEGFKNNVCGLCGKTFLFESSLLEHIKRDHPSFKGQRKNGGIIEKKGLYILHQGEPIYNPKTKLPLTITITPKAGNVITLHLEILDLPK